MKRSTLILEARPGDQITVGENVLVTVEEKSGRVARLRFEAPTDVRIRKQDNSAAAMRIMAEEGVLKK